MYKAGWVHKALLSLLLKPHAQGVLVTKIFFYRFRFLGHGHLAGRKLGSFDLDLRASGLCHWGLVRALGCFGTDTAGVRPDDKDSRMLDEISLAWLLRVL